MNGIKKEEILRNLKSKIEMDKAIIGTAAGMGAIAKAADEAGADLIFVYNEASLNMDAQLSVLGRIGYVDNCNSMTVKLGEKVLNRVEKAPVIAGVGAVEPFFNVGKYADRLMELGFSGVTNIPTAGGWVGSFGDAIQDTGIGFSAELDFLEECVRKDIFTVGYVFTEEEAEAMALAKVDVICVRVFRLEDESYGWRDAKDMEEAYEKAREMCQAVKKLNEDAIILLNGGSFRTPEDIGDCMKKTGAHGYVGDTFTQRNPSEHAIRSAVAQLKMVLS